VLDRSETMNPEARAALFMNRGNGTFEPKPTTFGGLDNKGICGEAADLNTTGCSISSSPPIPTTPVSC